jgi:predicted RNase H-like HicB family nuclease
VKLSAVLTAAPEGGYVAFNPETGTTTQGETVEEALANLREATELYEEYLAERGSRAKYEAVLAKVPDVEPEEYDRLDEEIVASDRI